jgi:hypothetical protein
MPVSARDQHIKNVAFASCLDCTRWRLQSLAKGQAVINTIKDKSGNRLGYTLNKKTIVIGRRLGDNATLISCPEFLVKASVDSGAKILCILEDRDYLLIFDGASIKKSKYYEVEKGNVTFSILDGERR